MNLNQIMHIVDSLSAEELDTLYEYIQERREHPFAPNEDHALNRQKLSDEEALRIAELHGEGDRHHPLPLDVEALRRLSAELREGWSEQDLHEFEWAATLKVIKPLAVDEDL
jgi:hypothetical protein